MIYPRVQGYRPRLALSVLLLLAAAAVPARGQGVTATISGTVKDTQGAVVPGATVTLIS
jgi:type 1 fimbria pilin